MANQMCMFKAPPGETCILHDGHPGAHVVSRPSNQMCLQPFYQGSNTNHQDHVCKWRLGHAFDHECECGCIWAELGIRIPPLPPPLPPQIPQGEGTDLSNPEEYECSDCGAYLVGAANRARHEAWHSNHLRGLQDLRKSLESLQMAFFKKDPKTWLHIEEHIPQPKYRAYPGAEPPYEKNPKRGWYRRDSKHDI